MVSSTAWTGGKGSSLIMEYALFLCGPLSLLSSLMILSRRSLDSCTMTSFCQIMHASMIFWMASSDGSRVMSVFDTRTGMMAGILWTGLRTPFWCYWSEWTLWPFFSYIADGLSTDLLDNLLDSNTGTDEIWAVIIGPANFVGPRILLNFIDWDSTSS